MEGYLGSHFHEIKFTLCLGSQELSLTPVNFFFFLFFLMFIFRERKKECKWGRGKEREGERESQAGSALSVHSPMQGLNSRTMRSYPELKSRVGSFTEPPRRPGPVNFLGSLGALAPSGRDGSSLSFPELHLLSPIQSSWSAHRFLFGATLPFHLCLQSAKTSCLRSQAFLKM